MVAIGPSISTAPAEAGYRHQLTSPSGWARAAERPGRHPTSCVIWSMQTATARINASSWSGAISMP